MFFVNTSPLRGYFNHKSHLYHYNAKKKKKIVVELILILCLFFGIMLTFTNILSIFRWWEETGL